MAGLLEFMQSPGGIGLLSAIAGGMANARRGTPINNIGRAGIAGMTGYNAANDQIRQEADNKQAQQFKSLQIDQMGQAINTQKEQSAWRAGLPNIMASQLTGTTDQGKQLADQQAGFGTEGAQSLVDSAQYAQPDAPLNVYNGPDKQAVQQYAMQPGSPYADKIFQNQFIPKDPKWDVRERNNSQTGKKEKVLVDLNNPTDIRPFGGQEAVKVENWHGNAVDPYAVKPGTTFSDPNKPFNPDGSPNLDYQDYAKRTASAGATKVVNTISQSTEKKYGEQFAGNIAKSDVALMEVAQKAPELAARANRVKSALSSGKIITGFGADTRLQIGKALGLMGMNDSETISNTEILSAQLAQNTMDAIKSSGMGGGNGFSNADRDFLEKAVGGRISLDQKSISRLADLAHNAATLSANKWNGRIKQIPSSAIEGTGLQKDQIDIPPLIGQAQNSPKNVSQLPTKHPAGVDANIWQHMTPAERKLWQK